MILSYQHVQILYMGDSATFIKSFRSFQEVHSLQLRCDQKQFFLLE